MLPWIFKGSAPPHPWVAALPLHHTALVEQHPAAQRVSRAAATGPKYPHQPCAEWGKDLGWPKSTWQLPYPIPSLSHPSLSSPPGQLLLGAAPGEAAALCKLLSPCLCLPGAQDGFTLPLSLCSEGAKSKSGHLEGENLLNVTWLQWGW